MPLECRRGHFVYDSISSGKLNQQNCKKLIQATADPSVSCYLRPRRILGADVM